jgi:hypothetical protein
VKAIGIVALLLYAFTLLDSCSPNIVVSNTTNIPVRVTVTSGGKSDVLSPSPHESSATEATEGPYSAVVISDAEWIAYAQLVRSDLNQQIANSDNLTGAQLLSLVQRLKDIAAKMDQFNKAAKAGAKCSGQITAEGSGGAVTVSSGVNGELLIACK